MSATVDDPWDPFTVPQVSELLRDAPGLWWLSGGWAIDEFLGGQSRPHGDIDITIARHEFPTFAWAMRPDIDIWAVRDGVARPVSTGPVDRRTNNLWARHHGDRSWRLQINLEDVRDRRWHYRRDPRVTRPIQDMLWKAGSLRCVVPSVQLLRKARDPRPVDEMDFGAVVPRLSPEERTWLGDAIRTAHAASTWGSRAELCERWDTSRQGSGPEPAPGRLARNPEFPLDRAP